MCLTLMYLGWPFQSTPVHDRLLQQVIWPGRRGRRLAAVPDGESYTRQAGRRRQTPPESSPCREPATTCHRGRLENQRRGRGRVACRQPSRSRRRSASNSPTRASAAPARARSLSKGAMCSRWQGVAGLQSSYHRQYTFSAALYPSSTPTATSATSIVSYRPLANRSPASLAP